MRFTHFFSRSLDLASPEDLRAFQLQLVEQGVSSTTINATFSGLTFFFGLTLERPSALKRIRLSTAQGQYATVRVNQSLVLHAQRSSGPWIKVKRASLAPGSCWLTSPPSDLEAEVAGNLRWVVDPPGGATFNIDLRLDQTREVRFSEPGRYRLSAHSSVWCTAPYAGNTLSVEVE